MYASLQMKLSQYYRKAFVTGASSGLGAAFVDMLLAEGLEVWGTSRDVSKFVQRDGFHPVELDLADPESVMRMMESQAEVLNDIDIFVNNAGAGVFSSFFEMEPGAIGEQLKVLLHGPIVLCHRVLQPMLGRGFGCMVNVSSIAAAFPMPWFSIYSAMKAGLSQTLTGIATIMRIPLDFALFSGATRRGSFGRIRVTLALMKLLDLENSDHGHV